MRILLVTPFYPPFISGAAVYASGIAQDLASNGRTVLVLTTTARCPADFWQPSAEPPLPQREILSGVEVERLALAYPWPAPYPFGLLRRAGHWLHRTGLPLAVQQPLLRWLGRWMPPLPELGTALDRLVPATDLVHAFDSSWDGLFTAAAEATHRYRKPFVVTPLMHLGDAGIRAHFQMVHQVGVYRQADAILALSQAEAAEYARLGAAPERVHVIPMGVEPRLQEDDAMAAIAFRAKYQVDGPLVAFLGANTYDKGAFTLALATAALNRSGIAAHVFYAGPQSAGLAAFLAQQPAAIRTALQDKVRVLGVVDEKTKHQLLAACDMLALPSQVDTFGIVLLEAWAHGKPVIGAAVGGIPEVIRDGQTGLLVPFGDVAALAAAIRRLIEAPDWARQLGQAGRELVLREYTWERTTDALTRVYADVLSA
ncbi:MAG: glycosyltransferase family 4 protein [Anaerolineae bacterium]